MKQYHMSQFIIMYYKKWPNNRVNSMNTVVTLVDFAVSFKEKLAIGYICAEALITLLYSFQCLGVSIILQ